PASRSILDVIALDLNDSICAIGANANRSAQTNGASQSTYALCDTRAAHALVTTLGRKASHRGRLGLIRAANRPGAALLHMVARNRSCSNIASANPCVGRLRRDSSTGACGG
ncbi:hypothetical protein, partial [Ramlibacter albus]|uniref:hypothetical protein n=1 Tax=Ramlibacter albus TaxID=2079448 RepID=UPI001C9A5017